MAAARNPSTFFLCIIDHELRTSLPLTEERTVQSSCENSAREVVKKSRKIGDRRLGEEEDLDFGFFATFRQWRRRVLFLSSADYRITTGRKKRRENTSHNMGDYTLLSPDARGRTRSVLSPQQTKNCPSPSQHVSLFSYNFVNPR